MTNNIAYATRRRTKVVSLLAALAVTFGLHASLLLGFDQMAAESHASAVLSHADGHHQRHAT